jgi:hypothetical protein
MINELRVGDAGSTAAIEKKFEVVFAIQLVDAGYRDIEVK